MKSQSLIILASFLIVRAHAQNVLFDFDSLAAHSGLPAAYTVGGITASLAATGQGFAIQPANTLGFTPAGFAGNCVYPNSINAADLLVSFSAPLTAFSILYATQELACDDSATMRVTAYMNGTPVGTSTTNATALCVCTWQPNTLSITTTQAFNHVVVHYDARPPTCQDWGPIFLADNMFVTPAALPMLLSDPVMLPSGEFQFAFTNWPYLPFTAFGATNPSLPFSNWLSLGSVTETSPGSFLFLDPQATNFTRRFYRVTSP